MGAAVRADVTATFIGLKAGLFTADGRDCAGEILFDDLEMPLGAYANVPPVARRLSSRTFVDVLRPRRRNAHKGEYGRVLVIGGGHGMPGAVRLCGEAALRAGAGLVTLATHPSHAAVINMARPELLAHGVRGARDLQPLIERATVIAIGPGLAQDAWARGLWRAALAADRPLVIDADALNLLAAARAARKKPKPPWILTPHPGEAARLLKTTTSAIQRDRYAAAAQLAEKFSAICVLKGAGTLIASLDGTWLCDRGNPGMASGGTGDVLTGVIAALLAQRLAPVDAARLGVWAHAVAGDAAAEEGETGLIAADLFAGVRRELNRLADGAAAV
jgi:NAD(P)H-hydrate epimerase